MNVLPRIDGGAIRSRLVAFLVGVGFLGMPPGAPGQSLERELYRQAPQILKVLKAKGYRNVGVLKFLAPTRADSAALMNINLANRLAVALVLRNHEDPPMGILRDANAVAAGLPGANHLTPDGRRLLFQARYALAWGSEKVMPDAFLTGAVKFNADFTKVTANLSLVDKERGILNDVFPALEAFTEPANLIEAGESFLLRGFFDKGKIVKENAAQSAQKVRDQKEPFPLAGTADAPVNLAIRYDDQEVPLEIREGKALIQEPRDGQKVVFTLRRQGESKMRYKVVLKVNGLNSVGKERLPDLLCRGWVLEPDMKEVEIKGFQVDDQIADEFQAVSHALVGARALSYGADIGTISMVVFAESPATEKLKPLPVAFYFENENVGAIHVGDFPKGEIANLDMLQTKLRGNITTRGLIEGLKKIPSSVETVTFRPEPTPLMSATITYYRP